jgi:hypothetical protein
VPNNKNPKQPRTKYVRVSEWIASFECLMATGAFRKAWLTKHIPRCASGGCTFTTIGGIFEHFGLAKYEEPGVYMGTKVSN